MEKHHPDSPTKEDLFTRSEISRILSQNPELNNYFKTFTLELIAFKNLFDSMDSIFKEFDIPFTPKFVMSPYVREIKLFLIEYQNKFRKLNAGMVKRLISRMKDGLKDEEDKGILNERIKLKSDLVFGDCREMCLELTQLNGVNPRGDRAKVERRVEDYLGNFVSDVFGLQLKERPEDGYDLVKRLRRVVEEEEIVEEEELVVAKDLGDVRDKNGVGDGGRAGEVVGGAKKQEFGAQMVEDGEQIGELDQNIFESQDEGSGDERKGSGNQLNVTEVVSEALKHSSGDENEIEEEMEEVIVKKEEYLEDKEGQGQENDVEGVEEEEVVVVKAEEVLPKKKPKSGRFGGVKGGLGRAYHRAQTMATTTTTPPKSSRFEVNRSPRSRDDLIRAVSNKKPGIFSNLSTPSKLAYQEFRTKASIDLEEFYLTELQEAPLSFAYADEDEIKVIKENDTSIYSLHPKEKKESRRLTKLDLGSIKISECKYLKKPQIYIGCDKKGIFLYQKNTLIENFDSVFFQINHKIIKEKRGFVSYHHKKSSLKIIPKLRFRELKDQDWVYLVNAGAIINKITDHQLLDNDRVIISGFNGFLAIYSFESEPLSSVQIHCNSIWALDLSPKEDLVALSVWGKKGSQKIAIYQISDEDDSFHEVDEWDRRSKQRFQDLSFKIQLNDYLVLTAATLHQPFTIYSFFFQCSTNKLQTYFEKIRAGYERADQIVTNSEKNSIVTGGWNGVVTTVNYSLIESDMK